MAALQQSGRWSRRFDRCQKCATDERPHMARGYCARCYENVSYHEKIEIEHRKRKARRLEGKCAKDEQRAREWVKNHPDRNRAYKREWARKNQNKWEPGRTVWTLYAGFWCEGVILHRENHNRVLVRLKGGTELSVGTGKAKKLRSTNPRMEPKVGQG